MPGQLVTGPCVPDQLSTDYSVTLGQVTWEGSQGANLYTVEAVTDDGQTITCSTTDTFCVLYNMACSQEYNITVTAQNSVCPDLATSEAVILKTEPCPPNNVGTSLDCVTGAGTVSWEMSKGALGYLVSLEGREGDTLTCQTTALHTSCSVVQLNCGTVYYASVKVLGETLNSTDSASVLLVSVPCLSANVQADVDCANASALVTWGWGEGAQSYIVTALGSDGHQASCNTAGTFCSLVELSCGQVYNLTLTTITQNCQVETPNMVSFTTRPCAPLNVGVDLQCGTHTATLSYEQSDGVTLYTASATVGPGGPTWYCNSTSSSCQFPALDCGETYSFAVTAHNSLCLSPPSSTVQMQTEPCQANQVTATGSCDSETVVVVWTQARGAENYVVTAVGDLGYMTEFQTNDSRLVVDLPCGQTYSFNVKGQDKLCDSPGSAAAKFRTAPCVPWNVQSFTQCENNLGSVSWAECDGAKTYTAIAVGSQGDTHMHITNSTSFTWEDLHCGDLYTIHIISNDYSCSSSPSNSTAIRTAPCVPQNLVPYLDCGIRVGSLSWNLSHAADFYVVMAESNAGHKVEVSTNDTNTYFSELRCGQEYYLSVQAVDSMCTSEPSLPATIWTEPCSPTSISSAVDCFSNIAVVTWLAAEGGAQYYTATAVHESGQIETCLSSSLNCGTPSLLCGQNYSVTVTASNQECHSDPSYVHVLITVPCVPTDVVALINCSDNTAAVTWSPSLGALSYRALAQSPNGALSSCVSSSPQCTLTNLTCGVSYNVQVVAVDSGCSSLPSHIAEFQTVPCTPTITGFQLDCHKDSALLQWASAAGAVSYNATARSAAGQTVACLANNTNCNLTLLACGQTYTVTMRASNGQCDSFGSTSMVVASVPCSPQSVVYQLNCSDSARVEWQTGRGADSYAVRATSLEGITTGCQTNGNNCSVSGFICGSTYSISVVAVSKACNTSQSPTVQLKTVPCIPQRLQAHAACETGSASVSWLPSSGAAYYTAVARSNSGYMSSCNSSNASCQFPRLLCGLSYSIAVRASDDTCTSSDSGALQFNAVPCSPQNGSAQMECSSNTGLVSWEPGQLASSYLVSAVGADGDRNQCVSNTTGCRIPSMHCGQRYNLTVTALDGICNNSHTYLTLQSVPCTPTNMRASLQCLTNSAAVAWEAASGAMLYKAIGTADAGHQVTCNNSQARCDLSGLLCGKTYNVTVVSLGDACSSTGSNVVHVRSAPCPPQDVAVDMQCANSSAVVTWSPNPDADSFRVTAVTGGAANLSCVSAATRCSVGNLLCGLSYTFTVTSVKGGCESAVGAAVTVSSAPCAPQKAQGSLDCVTNSAWVSWTASPGATDYTVIADSGRGTNATCNSPDTACNVPGLACSTNYTIHVTATNPFCQSLPSNTFNMETGPCGLANVTAVTACYSGVILVSWGQPQNSQLYVATAEGQDQSILTCNSMWSSCQLLGARCGILYTVIVSASSDKCSSLRSPPQIIGTAPCVPKNVAAVASCQAEGAVVSWDHSDVAQWYLLTAAGQDGDVRTCNSSVNQCTLARLHCGQIYALSVTAGAQGCTSQASPNVTFSTVPCEPTGLSVAVQCKTNSSVLSWASSQGSVQYYGVAQSGGGDVLNCNSVGTSCTIDGLVCGVVYNFTVSASNGACNTSELLKPVLMGAAPCAPAAVRNRMQLINGTHYARTSWTAVQCRDVKYLVEITGISLADPLATFQISSYWTEVTYFELAMPCGSSFNLTVRSGNSAGESEPSTPVTGITAPCAPLTVTYTGNNTSAVVSWKASMFATRYTVYNVTGGVRTELCTTPGLTCQLFNVQPGTIAVTASNAVGESVTSAYIIGPSNRRRRDLRLAGPMLADIHTRGEELSEPEVLVATVKGVSVHLKWAPVRNADRYTVVVIQKDAPSRRQVSTISDVVIDVDNLVPSTRYCVYVAAKNERTQSLFTKECVTTGVSV